MRTNPVVPELSPVELVPALIVEDNPATRQYLESVLRGLCGSDADIAAVATLAKACASLRARARPFVLVDIGLPDGNGIELIAWLQEHRPQSTTMVVSAWGDEETVVAALAAGAVGYLFKERDTDELRYALQSVQRGGAPIDPFVAKRILGRLMVRKEQPPVEQKDTAAPVSLTLREEETLRLVERGCSNREIAERMKLSRFTIEGYIKTIYRKLTVSSRTAAVFEAKSRGML